MGWLTEWRRKRVLRRHQIDDALWRGAVDGLAFIHRLPPAKVDSLRRLCLLFLAEKQFAGTHGLDVSDVMRVSIAAQACLPVLELGLDWYEGWRGIVVYPGDFRVQREWVDEAGVVHQWDDQLSGEAMPGGPVVLSWDATAHDPYMNVVIHEFAHKLDMRNGDPNGFPPLHAGMSAAAWKQAFKAAYEDFCKRVDEADELSESDDGLALDELPIDPYAATSAGEFFAVASEAFFETPELLAPSYPAVYEQLRLFYKQDPLARLN